MVMPSIVKSAARTLDVLEYISCVRRPVTSKEVVEALKIPQSSASSLLHSLVQLGYLEYLPQRTFRPTLRVALLGDWWESLTPSLRELHNETNTIVAIARQLGSSVQLISVLMPDSGRLPLFGSKGCMPLVTHPCGRAFLSAMTDEFALRVVRRFNLELRSSKKISEVDFVETLENIRKSGVSESDIRFDGPHKLHCISALSRIRDGETPITVALAGSADYIQSNRNKLTAALLRWQSPRSLRDVAQRSHH